MSDLVFKVGSGIFWIDQGLKDDIVATFVANSITISTLIVLWLGFIRS